MSLRDDSYAFPAGGLDQKTGNFSMPVHPGLSKRDFIAVHVFSSLLGDGRGVDIKDVSDLSFLSVFAANALLKACNSIDEDGDQK